MKRLLSLIVFLQVSINCFSASKTAITSGNWSTPSVWSPIGVPSNNDEVTINAGKTITIDSLSGSCNSINIQSGASLKVSANSHLTITSIIGFNINGTLEVIGDVSIVNPNTSLKLNSGGKIIWSPLNNTEANAQLFTQCDELFNNESTIQISKWFNTNKGLGQYISGNFGNISITGIWNWEMGESLRSHSIEGKLSVINSYVILDSSNTNVNLNINQIELQNSNSIIEIFKGASGTKNINCNSITINGGQLNLSSGNSTSNTKLKCFGDISINSLGTLCGSYQNDANNEIEIQGNLNITKSLYYGVYQGAGNHKLKVDGNMTLLKGGTRFSELHGIYNGNGNIELTIGGDFNHQGYSDLILNDGITGVGNGNAKINIAGHFQQSSGDFRGIFNLTSYNAGKIEFTSKDLIYSGGIFMLHYACSNNAVKNSFNINGDLTVNFTGANDIFRCNGLSNLNGTINNAQLELKVIGNSKVEGNSSGELLTNTAYGYEDIQTNGTFKISAGNIKFNYSPHPISWVQNGDFEISGGQLQTSMESGTANISFNGNFNQLNGIVCFKNKSGNTNISIAGNFKQLGGTCKFYDNSSQPLTHSIQLNVLGNFVQEQGRIDFCNNSFSTGNTTLQISGSEYQTSGGEIVSTSGITNFGNLKFCHDGLTNYFCSSSHSLIGIKQSIESNCKLEVNSNDYQISSGSFIGNDYLVIKNGAQLNLKNSKVTTSGLETKCGIKIEENAVVRIASEIGTEALSFPLGITAQYSIDKLSTIELNGSKTNITKLRGQSDFILGKLKINLDPGGEVNLNSDLSIESQLNLCEGYINLNKTSISILNNSSEGIVRTNGYVVCNEKEGTIKRTNNQLLNYEFPFGTSSGKYIPIFINCKSGTGKCLSANTISTNRANTPLPSGLSSNLASSINAISDQIDRWWKIESNGVIADVTLSYASEENSTDESKRQENFSLKYLSGTNWSEMSGNCRGEISNTGKITIKDIDPSATYTLLSNGNARPAEITLFDAIKKENNCELNWTTENEFNCKEYTVERSTDNIHFEIINTVQAYVNNNTQNSYQLIDNSLLDGKYYYRIKIKSLSGAEFYSETRIIEIGTPVRNQEKLEVNSVYPNPFSSKFTISYTINYNALTHFRLISMSGQTLFTSEKTDIAGENTFEYSDELRLPPGYYLLNVISGTQKFTSKIYKSAY